jgi:hypothetical protein
MDKVVITYHAVRQCRTRFQVWADISEWQATSALKACVEQGVEIGAQCWDGFAVEIALPDGIRAAAVGVRDRQQLVVKTILTLEQLASNIRHTGIRSPDHKKPGRPTRYKLKQAHDRRLLRRSIEVEDDEV